MKFHSPIALLAKTFRPAATRGSSDTSPGLARTPRAWMYKGKRMDGAIIVCSRKSHRKVQAPHPHWHPTTVPTLCGNNPKHPTLSHLPWPETSYYPLYQGQRALRIPPARHRRWPPGCPSIAPPGHTTAAQPRRTVRLRPHPRTLEAKRTPSKSNGNGFEICFRAL